MSACKQEGSPDTPAAAVADTLFSSCRSEIPIIRVLFIFSCLRARSEPHNNQSNSSINIQIHPFKTTFMCPRSIAGMPFNSVRRFLASLLLHTTCDRSWCTECYLCDGIPPKIKIKPRLARRVFPGGGVPLVGPQEKLRGPSGHTPKGFTSSPGREAK